MYNDDRMKKLHLNVTRLDGEIIIDILTFHRFPDKIRHKFIHILNCWWQDHWVDQIIHLTLIIFQYNKRKSSINFINIELIYCFWCININKYLYLHLASYATLIFLDLIIYWCSHSVNMLHECRIVCTERILYPCLHVLNIHAATLDLCHNV